MTTGLFNKTGKSLRGGIAFIARPSFTFYILPAFMVLLVCGTVAQRYIGLYDAHRLFFASFVLWAGPIPLPGGYTLSALFGMGLAAKFLRFSEWSRRKAGLHLAHFGALVLLWGGLLTALTAAEGFIVIPEGQSASVLSDYHQRELVISTGGAEAIVIPQRDITAGKTLAPASLPFSLKVHESCRNCRIILREQAEQAFEAPLRGMANGMALTPAKKEPEDEANLYGATIIISGASEDSDGVYVIFEAMPKPIIITHGEDTYEIIYKKQGRALPFSLQLVNFEKEDHPGTMMARAYSSDIIVHDGGMSWPVRIEMNKPLRYKGYTFFQSSFAEAADSTATILSVVRNKGWIFPYIGTGLMSIGLLLHAFTRLRERRDP